MSAIQLRPAYGRKCDSKEEAQAQWLEGRDFWNILCGGYSSIRDYQMNPWDTIYVRYTDREGLYQYTMVKRGFL